MVPPVVLILGISNSCHGKLLSQDFFEIVVSYGGIVHTFLHSFNFFTMKALTLPVIGMNFVDSIGKTAIQVQMNNALETVWANGNQAGSGALLVNLVVNEVGDTFVASNDSKQMQKDGKTPLFKKGDTVSRLKQTVEFKSFKGDNSAAQFAQAASAFGLQLVVQMG